MSYLLDALKQSEQSENLIQQPASAQSVYAEQSGSEKILQLIKYSFAVMGVTGAAFYAGYYYAQKPLALPNPPVSVVIQDKVQVPEKMTPAAAEQHFAAEKSALRVPANVSQNTLANLRLVKVTEAKTETGEVKSHAEKPDMTARNNSAEMNETINSNVNPKTENAVSSQPPNSPTSKLDETAISPELMRKFNQALTETMALTDDEIQQKQQSQVTPLAQFSADFQAKIPSLDFQTHIYSSEARQRWVKVNGSIYREGEFIANKLKLQAIEPQTVILNYDGISFSLNALSKW